MGYTIASIFIDRVSQSDGIPSDPNQRAVVLFKDSLQPDRVNVRRALPHTGTSHRTASQHFYHRPRLGTEGRHKRNSVKIHYHKMSTALKG